MSRSFSFIYVPQAAVRVAGNNIDGKREWYVDVVLPLVASHVNILVVRLQVGHPADSPGVTVEIEDHRLVHRQQVVELPVGKHVRTLLRGLYVEQVSPNHSGTFQEGPEYP